MEENSTYRWTPPEDLETSMRLRRGFPGLISCLKSAISMEFWHCVRKNFGIMRSWTRGGSRNFLRS